MPKNKFTFKKTIHTGRYSSFKAETYDVKLNRKQIGNIHETRNPLGGEDPNYGKFVISLTVKKEETKENPAPFKWIRFKKKYDTAKEAREYLTNNCERICKELNLYLFEQ